MTKRIHLSLTDYEYRLVQKAKRKYVGKRSDSWTVRQLLLALWGRLP